MSSVTFGGNRYGGNRVGFGNNTLTPPTGEWYGPQDGGGDFQMPEVLEDVFNKAQALLGSDVAKWLFSGLGSTAQVLGPSLISHYMGQEGREDAKAMYDAQASLLNQQTNMLRDRHTTERKPRANLLEAIASRMKQQAPSFLPDRPPPRRPYANVRRYDPRLTHQGRGDGYATRLSDALAYKWNPMGGR